MGECIEYSKAITILQIDAYVIVICFYIEDRNSG